MTITLTKDELKEFAGRMFAEHAKDIKLFVQYIDTLPDPKGNRHQGFINEYLKGKVKPWSVQFFQ